MHSISESQLLFGLLAIASILAAARLMGEVAKRVGQPEVLGQLCAGFVLGPSVFGALLPSLQHTIFGGSQVSLVLSGLSWVGAILLLLVAGLEVDLSILRAEARPGALAGALAILPSLVAGALFAWLVLHRTPPGGLFLGIVLSVSAVSVASAILIERGVMRRRFAQVIVAAGVASEVLVWLQISVVSSLHSASPVQSGLSHAAYAVGFFLFAMTIGRRFVFWAMRKVRDVMWVPKGQLSLVLVLVFGAAALTQALGLHALLGAFVVGVLLSRSPRANASLLDSVQTLTIGLFAPIFFVLAGMRVDVLQLGSFTAIGTMLLLFVVATVVKVGLGALGARLGGQRGWESLLVGVGLNLKGGTDVVVAVVGTELGLLTSRTYTMYAVVAILTVLLSPPLLAYLERRSPPTDEEQERLTREEAQRRSYVPSIERVLVPVVEPLMPSLAASLMERMAASKQGQGQLFDITECRLDGSVNGNPTAGIAQAQKHLDEAGNLGSVQVTRQSATHQSRNGNDTLESILSTASGYDLIAIGAHPPDSGKTFTLGHLQDEIVDHAEADVLVAINHREDRFDCRNVGRILAPINGLEYSMSAGDVAGSLAEVCDAELVIFHVVHTDGDQSARRDRDRLLESARGVVSELAFRVRRLGVHVTERVEAARDPGEEIVRELSDGDYDLVVLGGIDRGSDGRLYLGKPIEMVLTRCRTPAVLLVTHR